MKFVANVEVNHRIAASYSMPKRRSQRSVLSFGTKPGYPNELILVHQSNQNTLGTVYKVKDNVDRVFDKYAKEGKTTIRFKEPPHDLIINCETTMLGRFLQAFKLGLEKNVSTKSMKLPVVGSEPLKKIPPKPKQYLSYVSNAEYPVCEGFPKSAVSIVISGLQKTRFDMRLLGLPLLKVLDLSDNQLTKVPPEVDLLPSLRVLCLANNRLGAEQGPNEWGWLRGERLARQLQDLDLSGNLLSFLPPAVCHLKGLQILKLKDNQLSVLPGALGTMKSLKSLVASENHLKFLPGSVVLLRLWHLDVASNPFVYTVQNPVPMECRMPSLLEWTARRVVNDRLGFAPEDLPWVVQRYLDTVSFCQCRQVCFEVGVCVRAKVAMSCIAENIVRDVVDHMDVPVQYKLCSVQCMETFNNNCA